MRGRPCRGQRQHKSLAEALRRDPVVPTIASLTHAHWHQGHSLTAGGASRQPTEAIGAGAELVNAPKRSRPTHHLCGVADSLERIRRHLRQRAMDDAGLLSVSSWLLAVRLRRGRCMPPAGSAAYIPLWPAMH